MRLSAHIVTRDVEGIKAKTNELMEQWKKAGQPLPWKGPDAGTRDGPRPDSDMGHWSAEDDTRLEVARLRPPTSASEPGLPGRRHSPPLKWRNPHMQWSERDVCVAIRAIFFFTVKASTVFFLVIACKPVLTFTAKKKIHNVAIFLLRVFTVKNITPLDDFFVLAFTAKQITRLYRKTKRICRDNTSHRLGPGMHRADTMSCRWSEVRGTASAVLGLCARAPSQEAFSQRQQFSRIQ